MDPKLEDRLIAIERKIDNTNAMITKMRRVQRNANAFKLVYWLIIIGLGIVALFAIQPYITMLGNTFGPPEEEGNSLNSLLEQYQSLQQDL